MDIWYTTRIHREGVHLVAYAPELDISSCGATLDDARDRLVEAVAVFVAQAKAMGTLADVLEDAGYALVGAAWKPRDATWGPAEAITSERSRVTVAAAVRGHPPREMPFVPWRVFAQVIERAGFERAALEGDHLIYVARDAPRPRIPR